MFSLNAIGLEKKFLNEIVQSEKKYDPEDEMFSISIFQLVLINLLLFVIHLPIVFELRKFSKLNQI